MSDPSLCFIIACKQYAHYPSYLEFYVDNINRFYPTAKIILVDNNSTYTEIFTRLQQKPNVTVLINTSIGKFEIGAYKFATEYIIQNNLTYDYYICTQDTFVLVNRYNFNELKEKNIKAASLGHFYFHRACGQHIRVLSQLGIYDPAEEFLCCWCASWVCTHENLLTINTLLQNENPIDRNASMETERYMGKILKMLNNNSSHCIERSIEGHNYNCHTIDPRSEDARLSGSYFVKRAQQKNERTPGS